MFIDARIADWEIVEKETKALEWDQADSYWRYKIIRFRKMQNEQVRNALNEAKLAFTMIEEAQRQESADVRAQQMVDFAMQVENKRMELAESTAMKRMELSNQIMMQEEALEMLLENDQRPMVEEAFAECYEEVKAEIQELYHYIDVAVYEEGQEGDEGDENGDDGIDIDIGPVDVDMAEMDAAIEDAMIGMRVAPYRDYQNRNFLHKFGQWLDEQLIELDLKLGNMGTMHEAGVDNAEDESNMMAMNMAEESMMAANAKIAMLTEQAKDLEDEFASMTALELEALTAARPLAEAAAISMADELKK